MGRRNWETYRAVLLAIEAEEVNGGSRFTGIVTDNVDEHYLIADQMGHVDVRFLESGQPLRESALLTERGHDMAARLRTESVWEAIKARLLYRYGPGEHQALSVPFEEFETVVDEVRKEIAG